MSTQVHKIRLMKGDSVIVLAGKDKGKIGKVLATHPSDNKVTVEGVNIVKKHQKPNTAYPQGGIIDLTRPIWVSKVAAYDATKKQASKISYKVAANGTKTRHFKRTGKEMTAAQVIQKKGKK
jgi:large subunit ribosomal protein L24